MAVGSIGAGTAAGHRPDPIDWYAHKIIGCTGDYVVIEDSLPGGNVFTVAIDKALQHIEEDHGWSEATILKFSTELEKLCAGLEPDWDVLAWYSHTFVDCREGSDQRYMTVEDGLGYKFEIGQDFLEHHLEDHHGWPEEDLEEFYQAQDHYCQHKTS